MAPSKQQPPHQAWPSDDRVRELDHDAEFTGDGRKLQDSERVGGMAPDVDPDRDPANPPVRPSP
jgi:hypothetical protein